MAIIPVLVETTEECAVYGQVACERDLVYVDGDDAEDLDVASGAIVCRECGRG